jgi:hypothetical protein
MGIGKSLTRLAGCSALALALGGCGVPTALTVAGIAGDAVSRAATGKGMIDAAVSQVSERDCRMSRVLKGEDVCRDAAPEAAKPALAMAAAAPDAMPIADVTFEGRDGGGVMWAPVEGGWVPVDQATDSEERMSSVSGAAMPSDAKSPAPSADVLILSAAGSDERIGSPAMDHPRAMPHSMTMKK